jgi:hypothetical protein
MIGSNAVLDAVETVLAEGVADEDLASVIHARTRLLEDRFTD